MIEGFEVPSWSPPRFEHESATLQLLRSLTATSRNCLLSGLATIVHSSTSRVAGRSQLHHLGQKNSASGKVDDYSTMNHIQAFPVKRASATAQRKKTKNISHIYKNEPRPPTHDLPHNPSVEMHLERIHQHRRFPPRLRTLHCSRAREAY